MPSFSLKPDYDFATRSQLLIMELLEVADNSEKDFLEELPSLADKILSEIDSLAMVREGFGWHKNLKDNPKLGEPGNNSNIYDFATNHFGKLIDYCGELLALAKNKDQYKAIVRQLLLSARPTAFDHIPAAQPEQFLKQINDLCGNVEKSSLIELKAIVPSGINPLMH